MTDSLELSQQLAGLDTAGLRESACSANDKTNSLLCMVGYKGIGVVLGRQTKEQLLLFGYQSNVTFLIQRYIKVVSIFIKQILTMPLYQVCSLQNMLTHLTLAVVLKVILFIILYSGNPHKWINFMSKFG